MKEGETCLPPLLRWSKAYKRGEGDQCFPDVKCYKLLEAASRSYSNNPSLSKLLLQAFSCKEIALSELAFVSYLIRKVKYIYFHRNFERFHPVLIKFFVNL